MYMEKEPFYRNNRISYRLEGDVQRFKSFDEFERFYSREMLDDDTQIGEYLEDLLIKYDKPASATSFRAHLAHSYVGNIINFKKNNPSRDALISICLALGADVEEMLFTKINNKDEGASENMMYMVACGPGAEELLQEIYNNYDGEEFFIFEENLSRKADVVPAVTEALK